MSDRDAALAALESRSAGSPAEVLRVVGDALKLGLAAEAEPVLDRATQEHPRHPGLWQFLGLARRELQDSAGAFAAFGAAARLAPDNALIAHSHARTALEAGFPAIALFNRARLLAPADGEVALGRIAALFAEGKGDLGCDQLAHLLKSSPDWLEGHTAYARLSAQVRPGEPIDTSIRTALASHPQAGALWAIRLQMLMEARDFAGTLAAIDEARTALGQEVELLRIEAICRTELGEAERAQGLFDRLPEPTDGDMACPAIRNCIRLGRYDQALGLALRTYGGLKEAALVPYRALLWRLSGDPQWDWLEGDPRLIGSFDLGPQLGDLDGLAEVLRSMHAATGQPLDQSVRGGTQTDGNLLARAEPEVRQLRAALLEAVRSYVDQLPPPDRSHPLLNARRNDLRIAGSWSVRLQGGGFHADHVHWQGWISSAFYVVVPEADPDLPHGGWLTFGECRELLPDLAAFLTVEPAPGKLVLFPSTTWHGTRAFGRGERMTVAYDIARPGQA